MGSEMHKSGWFCCFVAYISTNMIDQSNEGISNNRLHEVLYISYIFTINISVFNI